MNHTLGIFQLVHGKARGCGGLSVTASINSIKNVVYPHLMKNLIWIKLYLTCTIHFYAGYNDRVQETIITHKIKQFRVRFIFLVDLLLCVSLMSTPALSKAPLQGVYRQAKNVWCIIQYCTALSLLFNFWSAIELPVVNY